jgi:hypothetical protein
MNLHVTHDGGGGDEDLALWHLGAPQVEHDVADNGQRRQGVTRPAS